MQHASKHASRKAGRMSTIQINNRDTGTSRVYTVARKPEEVESDAVKAGDLYYTSWGYDQTNYDYIAVVEVSKTGKTAKCKRAHSQHMGSSGQSNIQKPVLDLFGDVFTMQIKLGNPMYTSGGWYLRGSYPFCCSGTGSKRLDTFSRVKEDQVFHETDAMFGH